MNIKTANRLCDLRKKHGLSQEELAEKLGVSRQAVSKWERSESSPDTDNLIELAKLYGISLDELLNGDEAFDVIEENKEADKDSKNNKEEKGNGFYIHDNDGNEIRKDKDGLHLKDDEGNEIKISNGKATLKKSNGEEKTYSKDDYVNSKVHKINQISGAITGFFAILVTIVYLVLGFILPEQAGFIYYWFMFILIPVPGSIFSAIMKKDPHEFVYPIAITGAYCALGMFLNLWHPLWVLFISIPAYYIATSPFRKNRLTESNKLDSKD